MKPRSTKIRPRFLTPKKRPKKKPRKVRAFNCEFIFWTSDCIAGSVDGKVSVNEKYCSRDFKLDPNYRAFTASIATAWAALKNWRPHVIRGGAWRIEACFYHSTRRLMVEEDGTIRTFAGFDIDNPIKPLLDAFQAAGILDNDVRFEQLAVTKIYDPKKNEIAFLLKRLKDGAEREQLTPNLLS